MMSSSYKNVYFILKINNHNSNENDCLDLFMKGGLQNNSLIFFIGQEWAANYYNWKPKKNKFLLYFLNL